MTSSLNTSPIIPPFKETRILLHSCCAPCSCEIMEQLLRSKLDCTVFFYNPNIDDINEYKKRKDENKKFAHKLNIPFLDGDYENPLWHKIIKGYEGEPERGKRCELCFKMRLNHTAEYASKNNFRIFTSSLGMSRWKNFEQVSKCGKDAAGKYQQLIYWDYNWRKLGGSERMINITKKGKIYRQRYCGCIFSKLKI